MISEHDKEEGVFTGLGAIHSLDEGRVQLAYPIIYQARKFDDDSWIVGIEEFALYGAGDSEQEAVMDLQSDIWNLLSLSETEGKPLGYRLAATERALQGRLAQSVREA